MAKWTVPKLDRVPFKKPTEFVRKTNQSSESRIDEAFSRGLLTVTVPDSRRCATVPPLPGPMAEPSRGNPVQSAATFPPEIREVENSLELQIGAFGRIIFIQKPSFTVS
jgi:hypothetical protein